MGFPLSLARHHSYASRAMNLRNLSGSRATEMLDEVRHAFLKILHYTLLGIRSTKSSELSFALSDHAHNIPGLIDRYTPETFRYYWEVERACFIGAMEKIGEKPLFSFQKHWAVLERHYESLE